MRAAHKRMDLNEEHFQAVAEALQKTLQELGVSEPLIQEVMAIAGSTHDDVLNLWKIKLKLAVEVTRVCVCLDRRV